MKTNITDLPHDSFLQNIVTCQPIISALLSDAAIAADSKSKEFLQDLQLISETRNIPYKYKDENDTQLYTAWLYLINATSMSEDDKRTVCSNLFEKLATKPASLFFKELFKLPKIVLIGFLQYSSYKTIYDLYEYRSSNKKSFDDAPDYFADLVKLVSTSHSYPETDKKQFILHLLHYWQKSTEFNALHEGKSQLPQVEEALSCWLITNSLGSIDDTHKITALLSEEHVNVVNEINRNASSFLQAIKTSTTPIYLSSYTNILFFVQCLKNLEPNNYIDLLPVFNRINENEINTLYTILLEQGLQPKAILSAYALLTAQQNEGDIFTANKFPSFFIRGVLHFLKSQSTSDEFQLFVTEFVKAVNPVFYARQPYVFENVVDNLFIYWTNENQKQFITSLKTSLQLNDYKYRTSPIKEFIEKIASEYFTDALIDTLWTQLNTVEFITVFSVCTDDVQNKMLLTIFNNCITLEAMMIIIRIFNEKYPQSFLPTGFKTAFVKALESFNVGLFDLVKSEQLFGLNNSNALEYDLNNLKDILNNKQLKHEELRSEIRLLSTLNTVLKDDAPSVVIQMFNAIPRNNWPYLFIYFSYPIIDCSFPLDDKSLSIRKEFKLLLPKERTNTWLDNLETWKDFLLGTLSSISDMELYSSIAVWALAQVEVALNKSASYLPDFPKTVFKEFFLIDIVKAMRIFSQITKKTRDTYDYHQMYIVDDALIASWLSNTCNERIEQLSSAFTTEVLTSPDNVPLEIFLEAPYVRNVDEKQQLIFRIVNSNKMHLVDFLKKFTSKARKIYIQTLYERDPLGTEKLLLHAMDGVITQLPPNSTCFFEYISLLLITVAESGIDIFGYINQITKKDEVVAAISHLDFWYNSSRLDLKTVFKINSRLSPEHFHSNLVTYFKNTYEKYPGLYNLTILLGRARKIAIPPFHSYTDYLNNNPEVKNQYVQPILNEIESHNTNWYNFSFKQLKFTSSIIPDLDDLILKIFAQKTELLNQFESPSDYEQKKIEELLDILVQIYGAKAIVAKCRSYNLEKQVTYLENKFRYYPQILNQINVLNKWCKVILHPDYRSSEKNKALGLRQIYEINSAILEVLLTLPLSGNHPDSLFINHTSAIFVDICRKAKTSFLEFSNALPKKSAKLDIKLVTNGALFVNGIFARDTNDNHLSKAGIQFADKYLCSSIEVNKAEMNMEFEKLDSKSQALLGDNVSNLRLVNRV